MKTILVEWRKAPTGELCCICGYEQFRLVDDDKYGYIWQCPNCGCWERFIEDYQI